jgi:flagellar M-ring protein FliF
MHQEKMSASERAQLAMHMAEQQELMEKAKTNPYQVAQILQNWLTGESSHNERLSIRSP